MQGPGVGPSAGMLPALGNADQQPGNSGLLKHGFDSCQFFF